MIQKKLYKCAFLCILISFYFYRLYRHLYGLKDFDAHLLMNNLIFTYPLEELDDFLLLKNIDNIYCIRLEGSVKPSQSMYQLFSNEVIESKIFKNESLMYLGDCGYQDLPLDENTSLFTLRDIRIPSGTQVNYLQFQNNSLKVALRPPVREHVSVKIENHSSIFKGYIEPSNIQRESEFEPIPFSVYQPETDLLDFILFSNEIQSAISIRIFFSKINQDNINWFPEKIPVEQFQLEKCTIGNQPVDDACQPLVHEIRARITNIVFSSDKGELNTEKIINPSTFNIVKPTGQSITGLSIDNNRFRVNLEGQAQLFEIGQKNLKQEIERFILTPINLAYVTICLLISAMSYLKVVQKNTFSFLGPVGQVAGDVHGDQVSNQNNLQIDPTLGAELKEARLLLEDVQQRCSHFSLDNVSAVAKDSHSIAVKTLVKQKLQENPLLTKMISSSERKTRFVNALQSGALKTIHEISDHPLLNILIAIVEGWNK